MELIKFPVGEVRHDICGMCHKNGTECAVGSEVCLPLEMLVQLSLETRVLQKLATLDNVASQLDLKHSCKAGEDDSCGLLF